MGTEKNSSASFIGNCKSARVREKVLKCFIPQCLNV